MHDVFDNYSVDSYLCLNKLNKVALGGGFIYHEQLYVSIFRKLYCFLFFLPLVVSVVGGSVGDGGVGVATSKIGCFWIISTCVGCL